MNRCKRAAQKWYYKSFDKPKTLSVEEYLELEKQMLMSEPRNRDDLDRHLILSFFWLGSVVFVGLIIFSLIIVALAYWRSS